ncbi:MAG TPA: ABC transporter substrate-binding protein [Nocardioides sp.]
MNTRITTRMRWAGLLATTALVASGCASSADNDSKDKSDDGIDYTTRMMNVSEPKGEPVKGGTLRVAEYSEARGFNPTQTYPTGSTGGNILAALYDTLVRYNGEKNAYEPQLAESLESSDDVTWTIKLRDGVKFTDGTPLDAEAVVGSLNYYVNSYGLNATLLKQEIKSIKATDDLTVTITLNHAWPTFANMFTTGPGMIMAPAAYANPDPAAFKPIGAGPFKFESYAPAEKTVVVANEDYFDGRPNLDKIEFVLLGADATAYDSFKSGGIDVAYLRGTEVVDEAITDGVPGMVNHTGSANNLWINAVKGRPGEDKRVRQAIALAFDPEIYLERTANGGGNPTKLLLGESSIWSPGVEEPEVDQKAAKKLLEEAKADGYDGKISIIARSEQASQAGAVAIQAMLEAVGFDVELDLVQNVADQTQKIYIDKDFDIATAAISVHEEGVYSRIATALGTGSPTNGGGYSSPEMDALIQELQGKKTPEDAKDVLTRIEALYAKDVPALTISSGAMVDIWQKNVHGIKGTGETIVLFDDAWIEKK